MSKILFKNKIFKNVDYDKELDEYTVYLNDGYGSWLRFYGKDIKDNHISANYVDGCKFFSHIFDIEKAIINIERDKDRIYLSDINIIKSN